MGDVYLDGRFVKEEEAKISVFDRGFLVGDGAFAAIQVNEGIPLFLETHLERLKSQCLSFQLLIPSLSRSIIEELILRNQAEEGIWKLRILVTGGEGPEAHLPERSGHVVIFLKPFTPDSFKPLNMGIFPIPYSTCHASFKSLAHLNRFYVMEDAKRRGLDDNVTLTEKGTLLEAAFGNLFFIHETQLFTPDPSLPLYFGVTLKNSLTLAKEVGFEIQTIKSSLEALPKECSAFRTNTMQGIRPIAQIGEKLFKRNLSVETLLIEGYKQLIEAEKKQKKRMERVHAL